MGSRDTLTSFGLEARATSKSRMQCAYLQWPYYLTISVYMAITYGEAYFERGGYIRMCVHMSLCLLRGMQMRTNERLHLKTM